MLRVDRVPEVALISGHRRLSSLGQEKLSLMGSERGGKSAAIAYTLPAPLQHQLAKDPVALSKPIPESYTGA